MGVNNYSSGSHLKVFSNLFSRAIFWGYHLFPLLNRRNNIFCVTGFPKFSPKEKPIGGLFQVAPNLFWTRKDPQFFPKNPPDVERERLKAAALFWEKRRPNHTKKRVYSREPGGTKIHPERCRNTHFFWGHYRRTTTFSHSKGVPPNGGKERPHSFGGQTKVLQISSPQRR